MNARGAGSIQEPVTPYPDVNALLEEVLESARAILGEQFVGMYLFGSLASGDFDAASDIDFVVATRDDVRGDLLAALQDLHARLAAGESLWATQLEGNYIPVGALRRFDPAQALHPHIDRGRGERLELMQLDGGRVIERHSLREQGLALAGPPPSTLIDPIGPDELRLAVRDIYRHEWYVNMLDDPVHLASRGSQSYVVLTLCRMLYTLHTGTTASKPAAARWAQPALGEPWAPLIERAIAGRHTPDLAAEPDDVKATQELLRYVTQAGDYFFTSGRFEDK